MFSHLRKYRKSARILLVSILAIFCVETFVMLLLEYVIHLPPGVRILVDGLMMVVLLFLPIYLMIVRPMSMQIEEQHQTNLRLMEANEILERFFSISDVLIAYMDADFNFIRVNQAYAASDEQEPSFYVGKNHFDLFPNEDNELIFKKVVETHQAVTVVEKPFEYIDHPERGISYWDWNLIPVKSIENKVIALLMVLTNVTARKQAQIAREESERRFRGLFNQTFQHSALLDPSGRVQIVNQTAIDFTGVSMQDIQGQPFWEVPWWDVFNGGAFDLQAEIQRAASGKMVRFDKNILSADGAVAIMDIAIKPLLNDRGKTESLIYEARDITNRVRAREAIKRNEEEINRLYQAEKRAHQLADSLRSAVMALSGSLDVNTVLETLLNYIQEVVPYTSAHVSLFDDENHLSVRVSRGEEDWDEKDRLLEKRFETSDLPFLYPVLKEGKTINIPDTALYVTDSFLPTDHFVRSWLGVPLRAGDQLIGACILEHSCPDFFTENLVNWANAHTSQAGFAIQNAWLFEQIRDGREHLQALSRRLVEVQESERHFIARELHDEAGQALASLKVGLRLLQREADDPPTVIARTNELLDIADGVLEDLHRLSIDLRPAALDHLGLVPALRQRIDMIYDQYKVEVQFETVGQIERLPVETETAIYRIVQEALTNIIKHAQASHIDILLKQRGETLIVVIEDDGKGFDPLITHAGHLGLLGMRERADMLGGTLTVESALGRGTTIFLEIPCPSEL